MSTISSKGLPLAWLACLGVLAAVEVVLHFFPAGRLALANVGEGDAAFQYLILNRITQVYERPRLLVLGSSRARESIIMPVLREQFAPNLSPRQCRNYGLPSARALELWHILRKLRDAGKTPDVLILAVTPFELGEYHDDPPVGLLMTFHDLLDAGVSLASQGETIEPNAGESPRRAFRALPHVCQALADRHVRTLWLRQIVRLHGDAPSGMLGGLSKTQARCSAALVEGREPSLRTRAYSKIAVKGFAEQIDLGGRMSFANAQCECMIELLRLARECGCRTAVVELPVSRTLRNAYPQNIYEEFLQFFKERCERAGVPFIRLQDIGVVFDDDAMYDLGHVNWTGAEKFTRALAATLADRMPGLPAVVPRLRDEGGLSAGAP